MRVACRREAPRKTLPGTVSDTPKPYEDKGWVSRAYDDGRFRAAGSDR